MTVRVEFHFDFGSPNAYLAHKVIPTIEARTGVKFEYVPVLIGGVFKATNNKPPMVALAGIKNKPEYNALATERFKHKHGIDSFKFNPHFPINTLSIMRGAVYAIANGFGKDYIDAVYRCMWENELNMADAEVMQIAFTDAGLSAAEIIAGTADPAVKQQLIDNTNTSVARGNFGSPTFFVGDEMFFGKDRLRDVEEQIAIDSPPAESR